MNVFKYSDYVFLYFSFHSPQSCDMWNLNQVLKLVCLFWFIVSLKNSLNYYYISLKIFFVFFFVYRVAICGALVLFFTSCYVATHHSILRRLPVNCQLKWGGKYSLVTMNFQKKTGNLSRLQPKMLFEGQFVIMTLIFIQLCVIAFTYCRLDYLHTLNFCSFICGFSWGLVSEGGSWQYLWVCIEWLLLKRNSCLKPFNCI